MNDDDFKDGWFAEEGLAAKTIVWKALNPKTGKWVERKDHIFVVEELPYGSVERIMKAYSPGSDEVRGARIICEAIRVGENGQTRIPYEVAARFKSDLVAAMKQAYDEVHGFAKKKNNDALADGSDGSDPVKN